MISLDTERHKQQRVRLAALTQTFLGLTFAVVFVVFGFDVTSIPSVIVAVGALLDHKD